MKDSVKINIKPMSVNKAWQGRRFKTDEYKRYSQVVALLLPPKLAIPDGKLELYVIFGVSNEAADWDNPIKPLQDILQQKYRFNDKRIYRGIGEKVIVEKGREYIEFQITGYGDARSV